MFNNCIKLYWYCIFKFFLKYEWGTKLILSPRKSTLKKLSLISVNSRLLFFYYYSWLISRSINAWDIKATILFNLVPVRIRMLFLLFLFYHSCSQRKYKAKACTCYSYKKSNTTCKIDNKYFSTCKKFKVSNLFTEIFPHFFFLNFWVTIIFNFIDFI